MKSCCHLKDGSNDGIRYKAAGSMEGLKKSGNIMNMISNTILDFKEGCNEGDINGEKSEMMVRTLIG